MCETLQELSIKLVEINASELQIYGTGKLLLTNREGK